MVGHVEDPPGIHARGNNDSSTHGALLDSSQAVTHLGPVGCAVPADNASLATQGRYITHIVRLDVIPFL